MTRYIVRCLYNLMNARCSRLTRLFLLRVWLWLCTGSEHVGGVISKEATNVYHWHPHKANQQWHILSNICVMAFHCSVETRRRCWRPTPPSLPPPLLPPSHLPTLTNTLLQHTNTKTYVEDKAQHVRSGILHRGFTSEADQTQAGVRRPTAPFYT